MPRAAIDPRWVAADADARGVSSAAAARDWQAPRRATRGPRLPFSSALTVNSFNIITWRAEVEAIIYYYFPCRRRRRTHCVKLLFEKWFSGQRARSLSIYVRAGRMRRVFVYWQNFATAGHAPFAWATVAFVKGARTNYCDAQLKNYKINCVPKDFSSAFFPPTITQWISIILM